MSTLRIIQAFKPSMRSLKVLPNSYMVSQRFSNAAAAADGTNETPPSITLYQYAICPFCSKAKALLAYAGIEHEVVEVNPLTKAEIKW